MIGAAPWSCAKDESSVAEMAVDAGKVDVFPCFIWELFVAFKGIHS